MSRKYNITPKPTTYLKIWYRSRLEARWAVFFTALKISFRYEPVLFDVIIQKRAGGYLPDFFISKTKWFVEIKPTHPTSEEIEKALQVSLQTNCKIVILWWDEKKGSQLNTMFFEKGIEVFFEPSYFQLKSKYWKIRPQWILQNIVWLKRITGKKSFDKALKTAREYKFD